MFDLTIINQYIITMSSSPFLSKEVKLKRVLKGLAVFSPVMIMILVIGNYYVNLIDNALRNHYVPVKQEKVLGVEEELEPKLIGSYGDISEDDTLIWEWDWNREGYFSLNRYITSLDYYHEGNQIHLQDQWILKNGYELRMDCGILDLTKIAPFDPYSCSLYYNDKLITDDLTYVSRCIDSVNFTNCVSTVKLVVYSETSSDTDSNEYLALGSWASGSKDWISFYKLNNGIFTLMPFVTEDSKEDRWFISSGSFELYGELGEWQERANFKVPLELVTHFHEPSMGATSGDYMNNVEGIYRVWEITEDSLVLKERVVDLYNEGEIDI